MTIPVFGKYVKGDENATFEGDLISNLKTASFAPALQQQFESGLLPENGLKDRVVVFDGTKAVWESPPSPSFSAIIDKLAPLELLGEISHDIDSDQAGKFIVSDRIYIPASGEIDITIQGGNLVHCFTSDGVLREFSPKSDDVKNQVITSNDVVTLSSPMSLITYHRRTFYGIIETDESAKLYELDRLTGSQKLIGEMPQTDIIGLASLNNKLYMIAETNLYLYEVNPVPGAITSKRLGTHSGSESHAGIVKGTLVAFRGKLAAMGNRTGSAQPELIFINETTATITVHGDGFAFGNVNNIGSMFVHHDGPNDELFFVAATTGEVYHIAFATNDTTVSPRGNIHPTGLTWTTGVNAPTTPGKLVTDIPAFRTIPVVTAGAVANKDNSQFDESRQYFFGHTKEGKLAYGATASGIELRPMHIYTRTFSGGRRIPKTMLTDFRVPWNMSGLENATNLTLPEPWREGDIFKLTMTP